MATFIKQDNEKTIFNDDGEMIYYIPEKYFDINVAITIGEIIETLGIFTYGLYNSAGKQLKLERFKCPTTIQCKPSSITKEPALHLIGTKEESAYRLLHFKKGDELICNINIPKDIVNVEKFVTLLTGGNLPDNIPYNEIHEYVIKNASLNGFNYKVSAQIIGILISELYRDRKDLSKPFRLSGMKDMLDYKAISIKKVPKYTSPYTAITSENADEAIASAMTTKGTTKSPLEKVMMN
jgi:hypothetical protein